VSAQAPGIYDGTHAEAINELPANSGLQYPVDGMYYYLRKVHGAVTHWSNMTVDGTPFNAGPYFTLDMVRANGSTLSTAAPTSGTQDTVTWVSCS